MAEITCMLSMFMLHFLGNVAKENISSSISTIYAFFFLEPECMQCWNQISASLSITSRVCFRFNLYALNRNIYILEFIYLKKCLEHCGNGSHIMANSYPYGFLHIINYSNYIWWSQHTRVPCFTILQVRTTYCFPR